MRGLEIYLFGYTELEIVRKLANEIFIKHGENYTVHLKKKNKKTWQYCPLHGLLQLRNMEGMVSVSTSKIKITLF